MQIAVQAATAHAAACGRPPSSRAQPLLLPPPPAHQLHRGGPATSSVVCCDSISSSSSGVLEQPVFAAAEELLWEPEVLAPLDSTGYERAFNDYASATQVYEELERMQGELLSNAAVMDNLYAPSMPPAPRELSEQEQQAAERRRSARKASREARKQQQQAQAQAQQQQQQQDTSPADLEADLDKLAELRNQLSELSWLGVEVEQQQQQQAMGGGSNGAAPEEGVTGPLALVPPTPAPAKQKRAPRATKASASAAAAAAAAQQQEQQQLLQERRAGQHMTGPSLPFAATTASATTATAALAAPLAGAARTASQRRAARGSPRAGGLSAAGVNGATAGPAAPDRVLSTPDNTQQFMKAAGSLSLLQPAEQKDIAAVVKDYLLLQRIRSELKDILKREPGLEEWALAAKMEARAFGKRLEAGKAAKTIMVRANYRLVLNIVSKYRGRGMEMHDLIAEGMHGLLRGVEKFDADKGFRFSTYAHWWIRQSVTRAISTQSRAVRVPHHMQELLVKVRAIKARHAEAGEREPSDEEVAAELKVPVQRIHTAVASSQQPKSLDTQLGDSDEMGDLKDQLADMRVTPEELFEEDQMQATVRAVLQELDEREAGIVRMRLGIDGSEVFTLEDIGRKYSVTRERVRQVEAKAMHKLQERAGAGSLSVNDYDAGHQVNADRNGNMVARASRGTHKS